MTMLVRVLWAVGLYLGVICFAQAEKISATLPSGMVINAEFRSGDVKLPALLVIHGFLQTRDFQATKNILEGLADMGYEVLGPSLSLGVRNRRKSLSCEALHAHTLEDDIEELHYWVGWLQQRGHPSVVLVGHSWGGQHVLAYAAKYPASDIAGVIAVSLVRSRQSKPLWAAQKKLAEQRLASGAMGPDSYALNFCKKYIGTPRSYLSYAAWNDARVLRAIREHRIPVFAILGGSDRRIDDAWIAALRASGAQVSKVANADHFFSSQFEFDLLDELEKVLDSCADPRSG